MIILKNSMKFERLQFLTRKQHILHVVFPRKSDNLCNIDSTTFTTLCTHIFFFFFCSFFVRSKEKKVSFLPCSHYYSLFLCSRKVYRPVLRKKKFHSEKSKYVQKILSKISHGEMEINTSE